MKNSIKRAQSERSLSAMSNVRILREAKKYFAMAAAALVLAACDKNQRISSKSTWFPSLKAKPRKCPCRNGQRVYVSFLWKRMKIF